MNADPVHYIQAAIQASLKKTTLDGREYLVAPVVGMTEGVRNGFLVLSKNFKRTLSGWNGRPIVLRHPMEKDQPISANSPTVLERQGLGMLFDSQMSGDRFLANLWIDVEKVKRLGGDSAAILKKIVNGKPVEVSVGYFADLEERKGTYNNQNYVGIHHNIVPDHIALLVEEAGACSWKDGCGTPRVNQQSHEQETSRQPSSTTRSRAVLGYVGLETFALSYRERMMALGTAIEKAHPGSYAWVEDFYDDLVMYGVQPRETGPANPADMGSKERYFKRSYAISETGEVTLSAEAKEVFRKVVYVEQQRDTANVVTVHADLSFTEIAEAVYSSLRGDHGDGTHVRLIELYDSFAVYEVIKNTEGGSRSSVLFKRSYVVDEGGAVTFGDPKPVTKRVEYIEIQSQRQGGLPLDVLKHAIANLAGLAGFSLNLETSKESREVEELSNADGSTPPPPTGEPEEVEGQPAQSTINDSEASSDPTEEPEPESAQADGDTVQSTEVKTNMEKAKLIDALIAHESTPWGDGCRQALESFSDEMLQKMLDTFATQATSEEPAEQSVPAVNAQTDLAKTIGETVKLQVQSALREVLPAETLAFITNQTQQIQAHRKSLESVAKESLGLSDSEVAALSTHALERVVQPSLAVNYAGKGAPSMAQHAEDSNAPPPVVMAQKN